MGGANISSSVQLNYKLSPLPRTVTSLLIAFSSVRRCHEVTDEVPPVRFGVLCG